MDNLILNEFYNNVLPNIKENNLYCYENVKQNKI